MHTVFFRLAGNLKKYSKVLKKKPGENLLNMIFTVIEY